MRLPYLQVADAAWTTARQLGALLGVRHHEALGVLVSLWRWGVELGPADAAPSGRCDSPRAPLLLAAAVEWSGDPAALLDALADVGAVEIDDAGVRVRGLDRYEATWRRNRALRGRRGVAAVSPRCRRGVAAVSPATTRGVAAQDVDVDVEDQDPTSEVEATPDAPPAPAPAADPEPPVPEQASLPIAVLPREAYEIADAWRAAIVERQPGHRLHREAYWQSQRARWAAELERLHRIEERRWEEIRKTIEWTNRDPFWSRNCHGPASLRERYDRLEAARDGAPTPTRPAPRPRRIGPDPAIEQQARDLAEHEAERARLVADLAVSPRCRCGRPAMPESARCLGCTVLPPTTEEEET